ncbi:MAG: DUF1311 domain-containing protein [Candidatus Electrothrix sp. LOE2]|nr:DUF1311 domain-containing protein [Candidatus Electrothrix sp. LOE2]
MKGMLVLLCVLLPNLVLANSNCDNPRNDFDGLYCLNKIYLQADKELNQAYAELKDLLDDQGKKLLKKGQLTWIGSRDSECSYRDNRRGFFVNLDCAAKTTIERTQFLIDRKRECLSSGCLNSRLEE